MRFEYHKPKGFIEISSDESFTYKPMLQQALNFSSAILLSEDEHFIVFTRMNKIFAPKRFKDFTDVEHIFLMQNIMKIFFGNDASALKNQFVYCSDEAKAKFNNVQI
jgi:hypothetical protein